MRPFSKAETRHLSKKRYHTEPFLGTILRAILKFLPKNPELKMVLDRDGGPKKVLDVLDMILIKGMNFVPKFRTF